MKPSKFVTDYLNRTQGRNNAHQMNFSGDSRFSNYTGNNGRTFNATGPAMAPAAAAPMVTPSHPYAITISNSSGSTVTNFALFGGNSAIYATGWSGGSYTNGSITVTGLYTSYQNLVSQSQTQPFTIGSTYVTAITNNAQIQQGITVTTTDASGRTAGIPIQFLKDPYQNQTDTLVNNQPYTIDGTTTIAVSQILPNAVFTMYFWPANNLNPASVLNGNNMQLNYQAPGLIRVLPTSTGVQ